MTLSIRQGHRQFVIAGCVLLCTNSLYAIGWMWIQGLNACYEEHILKNLYPAVTSLVLDYHAWIILGLNAMNIGALYMLVFRRIGNDGVFAGMFLIAWGMVSYVMIIAWAILRAFFFALGAR